MPHASTAPTNRGDGLGCKDIGVRDVETTRLTRDGAFRREEGFGVDFPAEMNLVPEQRLSHRAPASADQGGGAKQVAAWGRLLAWRRGARIESSALGGEFENVEDDFVGKGVDRELARAAASPPSGRAVIRGGQRA